MRRRLLIIHAKAHGDRYAPFIAKEVNLLGVRSYWVPWNEAEGFFLARPNLTPECTLLHYRSAGPVVNRQARRFEQFGFRVVNPAKVLCRTSDKFRSFEWARVHGVSVPITHRGTAEQIRRFVADAPLSSFVLKPVNSQGGGIYCFRSFKGDPDFESKLVQVPGKRVICQEFVDYLQIFRVIYIGGEMLEAAVFCDEPTNEDWKVSVCLNPSMRLCRSPDRALLEYARMVCEVFQLEIGFVDIYETKEGYVLSEINTACNLTLHERKSGVNISLHIAKYLMEML